MKTKSSSPLGFLHFPPCDFNASLIGSACSDCCHLFPVTLSLHQQPLRLSCPPVEKSSLCFMPCAVLSDFSFVFSPCLASFVSFVLSLFVCFSAWAISWSEYSSLTFYLSKSVPPPTLQIELPPCVWLISYSFLKAIQLWVGLWWSGRGTQRHNVAIQHQQASKTKWKCSGLCCNETLQPRAPIICWSHNPEY